MKNRLYYGDNLEILSNREYFPDECVDLIYLDPPFNSNRNYNVLFKSESGADSEAQITAFEDTWHWSETAEATYDELIVNAPHKVSTAIEALMNLIERNQMMAYLVMMAARLVELHRVLKPTGSLYLHCDPTASHYLKIVLDAIFDPRGFRNEVIWQRTSAHDLGAKQWPAMHDIILMYSKSDVWTWKRDYVDINGGKIKGFPHTDDRGAYATRDMTGGKAGGTEAYQAWRGRTPSTGRAWALPGYHRFPEWLRQLLPSEDEWVRLGIHAKMDALDGLNAIHWPGKDKGMPRLKYYLEDSPGILIGDNWTDIPPIGAHAKERLGYPTQKPEALLERIIRASSNEGGLVLDPFCGCGTAIAAAHKLGRAWIGIDITHLSIALQKYRLQDMFELVSGADYEVIGEPATVDGARELAQDSANEGRYQFEWWALSLVRAKPVGGSAGSRVGKKGADAGIDGIINFFDEDKKGKMKPQKVVVQVKSGKVKSGDIRDLKGTVEREGAAIGVFITLEKPTQAMIKEALAAGTYESPAWGKTYRRLQILTIGDLFDGAGIDMPPPHGTLQQASRWKRGAVSEEGKSQQELV